jgi:DNA repair protein RadC
VLSSWDRLTDYLMAAMGQERTEQFRVLFLDTRNRLLADEVQGKGSINHAPAYPREVVRRCLELHATAIVLAHNHPSGDPTPSRDDVTLTREIARAAATMGISVHDHVVIGRGKFLSFKAEQLL